MTRQQAIQHVEMERLTEFHEKLGPGSVTDYFNAHPEHPIEDIYEDLCDTLHMHPLSEEPSVALAHDSALDDNPVVLDDLLETAEWVLGKLKAADGEGPEGSISVDALYSMTMPSGEGPGDITLYRVFQMLIACKAGDGIPPYAKNAFGEKIHSKHTTMTLHAGPNLDKIKSIVVARLQDFNKNEAAGKRAWEGDWSLARNVRAVMFSEHKGEDAANELFGLLNIGEADARIPGFRGPSMSVGDVAETKEIGGRRTAHLCMPQGWEEKVLEEIAPSDPNELPRVHYNGQSCTMTIQWAGDRPKIQLWSAQGPEATATSSSQEIALKENEILVKEYKDENVGMSDALRIGGVGKVKGHGTIGMGAEVVIMEVTHPAVLAAIAACRPKRKPQKAVSGQEIC